MAAADPRIRKIKIQTGVVKRLTKEKDMYEKEAMQLEQKVKQLECEKADEYVIRKQREVHGESVSMMPDTMRRLKNAYDELKTLLDAEAELAETEEYKQAMVVLEAAKSVAYPEGN